MATYPHVRPGSATSELQGFYALEGRKLPQEIFEAFVQGDTFDTNKQYWLQKITGGSLHKVRVDRCEPKELPTIVRDFALAQDVRPHQQYKLYVGNTAQAAVAVEQNTTSTRRFRVVLSLS